MTPAELITGIVTEEGVISAPFEPGLRAATESAIARWSALPGHDRPKRLSESEGAPPAVQTAPTPASR